MINFNVTEHDRKAIQAIADRAVSIAIEENVDYGRIEVAMDITATHATSCPLRLRELLTASDFNFTHDVFGIRRHLNRTTGELENCFVPRYAQH